MSGTYETTQKSQHSHHWSLRRRGKTSGAEKIFKEIMVTYDPAIPLLGLYPDKILIQKDTYTLMFIAALFTIAKTWKKPKCPSTDKCIKKIWYIYNGILLSHKKE